MSDVLLTNHKNQLYAEIEFDLENVYQDKTTNFIYNGERITKFNFEEFATDTDVIVSLFDEIKDIVYELHHKELGEEEQEYFNEFASEHLYNLLDEDLQEHRQSEMPSEEPIDRGEY
jgi:hypothetical protein